MCSAEGTSQELFIVITVKEGGFFFSSYLLNLCFLGVLFKKTASNQSEEGDLGNDLALKGSREVLDTVLATF